MESSVALYELTRLARALCDGGHNTKGFTKQSLLLLLKSLAASDPAFRKVMAKAHPKGSSSPSYRWDLNRHVGMVVMAVYMWTICADALCVQAHDWPEALCFTPTGVFSVLQALVDGCRAHGALRATAATAMLAPLSADPLEWLGYVSVGDALTPVPIFRFLLPQEALAMLQEAAAKASPHSRHITAENLAKFRSCAAPLDDGRTLEDVLKAMTPPSQPLKETSPPREWLPGERLAHLVMACDAGATQSVYLSAATRGACRLADNLTDRMGDLVTKKMGLSVWERTPDGAAIGVCSKQLKRAFNTSNLVMDVQCSNFETEMARMLREVTIELAPFYATTPHSSPQSPPHVARAAPRANIWEIERPAQVAPGIQEKALGEPPTVWQRWQGWTTATSKSFTSV